jgi:predicted solute-binding protein
MAIAPEQNVVVVALLAEGKIGAGLVSSVIA